MNGDEVKNKIMYFSFAKVKGFNLTVMTCMGLVHLTKKTQSPPLKVTRTGKAFLVRTQQREILALWLYF